MGVGGFGHLAQPKVQPLGEQHVQQAYAVAAGNAGAQMAEGLREADGRVHLEHQVSDAHRRHPPVEIENDVLYPLWSLGNQPVDSEHAVRDATLRDRAGPRRLPEASEALGKSSLAVGQAWGSEGTASLAPCATAAGTSM